MELQGTTFRVLSRLLPLLLVLELVHSQTSVIPVVGTEGDSVTLTCDLEVADPISLQWRDTVYSMDRNPATIFCTMGGLHDSHHNHAAYEIDRSNPLELTINDLKDSDVGSYFCVSTLADGTELTQQFTLGLAGDIACESDRDTEDLTVGDHVDASCKVPFTSTASPQFKWFIGEEDVAGKDKSGFGQLWIEHDLEATKEMDQQKLTCKLSFHGFKLECSLPLSVKHAPYVKMFDDSIGEIDKKHSFKCTVSANPAPAIDVLKVNADGTSSSLDSRRAQVNVDGSTATITFKKLKKEDAGEYRCEASNTAGDTSGTAMLKVSEEALPPTDTEGGDQGASTGGDDKNPSGGDGGAEGQFVLTTSLLFLGLSMLLHLL